MAPRREVGFSWHPTVSRGLSVARSLALPQIRGCSPLMTRVPWRRRETLVRRGTVLLVCYNAGYQVGKLTGLPSRRKGIMSMARYHYTRENENGVVLYLESEPAEDAMDEFDDEIAVGFSGNGYLSFWTRCRRAAEALPNGLKYAAGGRCVITDTFTGEDKIWRVGL